MNGRLNWPAPTMDDTQPTVPLPKPDDVETGPLPWETGQPTDPQPRVSRGATPTAGLPRPVPPPERTGYVPPQRPAEHSSRERGACAVETFFIIALVVVVLFFVAFAGLIAGYGIIAAQLPPPDELMDRQSVFVSSQIYDRDGNLLYEVVDPQGGRRTRVTLDRISSYLLQATIATEDANFYRHPGFDPIALIRMIYYNLSAGEIVSGGSTISQQLVRNLFFSAEERVQRTAWRKIREIILATEITRRYPRDTILEIYLNEIYYGNLAYGIEAAAQTYFRVHAADLTLAQASFLAGLPQSPATYDPFGGGLDRALARHQDVLRLMVEQGYISQAEAAAAAAEIAAYDFVPPVATDVIPAPHFVTYVRQVIEATYGPEALYRGDGFRITTTLDPDLQALAEQAVADQVAALADNSATNGALVAIEPSTGYIVAMVGSADFYDEAIDGQVNVVLRERQPGSAIKPLTYAAALERGWTPSTLIWDLETEFPDGANPPYVPQNYDGTFHGPQLVRSALANSLNIPAVKTLQFVGIPALREMAARLGITTFVREDYGLSLTLGGGEVQLLELTGAYAVFANGGVRVPPTPILRIEDSEGNVLVDNSNPVGQQAIRPEHAYLITSILSDRQARCMVFSCPGVLELSRPAAAKTGTTNDYRDAWTIGYTPDLVAGVWVGNSDNSPMDRVAGSMGAAPIWHNFMEAALADRPVQDFVRPAGIVEMEICADSGAQPSPYCPNRRMEVFAADQPPAEPAQDWYQTCEGRGDQVVIVIADPQGRQWAQQQGWPYPVLAPEECNPTAFQTDVHITSPYPGALVNGLVQIVGTVAMPNFDHYEVQYGVGSNPEGWGWISGPHLAPVREGEITVWDTTYLAPGVYTLRVTAWDREGRTVEGRVECVVAAPTLVTPTETPTPLTTPTETPTPTGTPTLFPTWTPTVEPTWTPTVEPTWTPTIEPTWTPTTEPTVIPGPGPTLISPFFRPLDLVKARR